MISIKTDFTGSIFVWTKDYLIQVLTTGKNPILTNPLLIHAINVIDRADFVPERLKSQAYNDVEIQLGYGESLTKPTTLMHMLELLRPDYGQKILDIGSGTGYAATILGVVVGASGSVYSLERIQWLWEQARINYLKYKNQAPNVNFLYRDGLDGLANQAPFDRIHIAFAVDKVPDILKNQLKVNGGILVAPTKDYNLKVIERNGIEQFTEETLPGVYIEVGKTGLA